MSGFICFKMHWRKKTEFSKRCAEGTDQALVTATVRRERRTNERRERTADLCDQTRARVPSLPAWACAVVQSGVHGSRAWLLPLW